MPKVDLHSLQVQVAAARARVRASKTDATMRALRDAERALAMTTTARSSGAVPNPYMGGTHRDLFAPSPSRYSTMTETGLAEGFPDLHKRTEAWIIGRKDEKLQHEAGTPKFVPLDELFEDQIRALPREAFTDAEWQQLTDEDREHILDEGVVQGRDGRPDTAYTAANRLFSLFEDAEASAKAARHVEVGNEGAEIQAHSLDVDEIEDAVNGSDLDIDELVKGYDFNPETIRHQVYEKIIELLEGNNSCVDYEIRDYHSHRGAFRSHRIEANAWVNREEITPLVEQLFDEELDLVVERINGELEWWDVNVRELKQTTGDGIETNNHWTDKWDCAFVDWLQVEIELEAWIEEEFNEKADPLAEAREVLGFDEDEELTRRDVSRRKRELAFDANPDRGGSLEKMKKINNAADVLLASIPKQNPRRSRS
jgi:hypothetical protein